MSEKEKKESMLKDLSEKLGVKAFRISASNLVELLNYKFKSKDNGKPFIFNDVQQYYLREKLPPNYGGVKITKEEDATGKYLQIYKE